MIQSLYTPPSVAMSGVLIEAGARIDAICYIGNETWVCGGRRFDVGVVGSAGKVWRKIGTGAWQHISTLTGLPNINAMEHGGGDIVYALTGDGRLWKSTDKGENWGTPVLVSTSSTTQPTLTYGLCVTPAGTVLVSDTRTGGGKIYRSTTGGASFSEVGAFTTAELYRFMNVGDGIICNGWAGRIIKSTDDGVTWPQSVAVSSVPIYAIAYLGDEKVLVGDQDGSLFLSENNGNTFSAVGTYDGASDDIASFGDGRLVYCTYTSNKRIYFSDNYGRTMRPIGPAPGGIVNNNVDRMAIGSINGKATVVGGCTLGTDVIMSLVE